MRHYRWKCKRDSGVGIRLFQLIIVPRRLIFCLPGFVFSSPLLLPIRHTVSETADCTITLRIVYIFYFFTIYILIPSVKSGQRSQNLLRLHAIFFPILIISAKNVTIMIRIFHHSVQYISAVLSSIQDYLMTTNLSFTGSKINTPFSGGYMASCCFPQP